MIAQIENTRTGLCPQGLTEEARPQADLSEVSPSHRGLRAGCCPVRYLSLQLTSVGSGAMWQMSELKLKRVVPPLGHVAFLVTKFNVSLGLSLG